MNRGSEWRKWDLHFHTPASSCYQNSSVTAQQIVDGLLGAGIEVVAITDHHCINVEFIKELKEVANDRLTIFPGIELRSELGGRESVHFIGIFPEDCDVEDLWTKLQVKLHLTPKEIADRGGEQAIYEDFKETANIIHELGGLVSCHAGKKSGTIERIANAAEFKQAVKEDLARDCIDILEIGRVQDEADYREIVFPDIGMILPLVIGSDNHNVLNYTVRGPCWIKADPTFSGLRQVLNEPESRVYLGDLPPCLERVGLNKTKYVDCLNISKVDGSVLPEKWFDCEVPFHHGLVAVIGNKGSGKSALTDTLGLIGNSAQHNSFSFLNSEKFKQPKANKAEHFEATLQWKSGVVNTKNLNDDIEYDVVETVKYIPQNYLEIICNEIREDRETNFDKELKAVIFSHVNEADRLGQESLGDLIDYKTSEIYSEIKLLKEKLQPANIHIVAYEESLSEEHRKSLEYQLQLKKDELEAHKESKPAEVTKPDTDPQKKEAIEKISKAIKQKQKNIKALEIIIKDLTDEEKTETKKLSVAELLLEKIENFERQYKSFETDSEEHFEILGIKAESVVSLKIDREPINKLKAEINQKLVKLKNDLDMFNPESPVCEKAELEKQVQEMSDKLDEPNRQYQAYLLAIEKWEDREATIIGDEKTSDTIKYFEKQLIDLKDLPEKLNKVKEIRKTVVKEIFGAIKRLTKVYESLYSPVQDFIENHPIAKDKFNLDFQVSIVNSGFEDIFFDYISHGVKGSFCGRKEGRKRLKEIVAKADFESESGVLNFLDTITGHLSEDRRYDPIESVRTKDQLRQGKTLLELYDFLFSFDYLIPKYTLQWSGKGVDQLSPGERGTLLLVFYLLIDKSDIPLILDQPEENLDNQTVYNILVQCVKEVKMRRQIIIVTHNPNLAVVCDADQVIYSSIDKEDGNRVAYVSGGIENPVISKHVVDVLEGTMPAFDDRDRKYDVVS